MPRIVDVDERRSELAAAASRVIARSGIAGASMREVAAEAGWTTGTLVHYFTDKHELLRFTFEESLARRHALRERREAMTPAEALRDTLLSALPTDEDSRLHWLVTVAFCAQATADPELAALQRDAYREYRSSVARLVVASGRAAAGDARSEAERLIAVVDGVAMQALFDPASWPPGRQRSVVDDALAPLG
ncbi:MAG: TetR family transcriptional regulator [Ilumatobacteraceae bacterium]|nr:TetR family transcriptional regulator [Ilumatobacteraceae bacterium]